MRAAITVMYKAAGFNPEVGDWFWAKFTPDGKVEAKGNDFLFTGNLK